MLCELETGIELVELADVESAGFGERPEPHAVHFVARAHLTPHLAHLVERAFECVVVDELDCDGFRAEKLGILGLLVLNFAAVFKLLLEEVFAVGAPFGTLLFAETVGVCASVVVLAIGGVRV